jgi:hypothetical protein
VSYADAVTADSPLAWWKLDETAGSSSVADSSGNGHTGSSAGVTYGVTSPAPPAGLPGPSSSWPTGATQNITVTGYQPSFTAATWEFWLNRNSVTQADTNPRIWGDCPSGNGFDISLGSGVTPSLRAGNGSASFTVNSSTTISSAAAWHHLVFTYDGANLRFYLDGALACTPVAMTGTITAPGGSDYVRLGGNFPWQTAERFGGLLAQVALYGTALPLDRIQAHYTAGTTSGEVSGPNYAGTGTDLGGFSGSWANPSYAAGTGTGSFAAWAVP